MTLEPLKSITGYTLIESHRGAGTLKHVILSEARNPYRVARDFLTYAE